MITLKEYMEVIDFHITESEPSMEFQYGNNAYCFSSWDGDQNGKSAIITYDTSTKMVYDVAVHDYKNNLAYRLVNPQFNYDILSAEAWEDVNYVNLDSDEEFMTKFANIYAPKVKAGCSGCGACKGSCH